MSDFAPLPARRIRVLVVDDSAMARWLLRELLQRDSTLVVVGEAANAAQARTQIKALDPDVVTLDVEMPGMDGLTFLRNLMRLRPTPVVMVSSRAHEGGEVARRALRFGAVDCVSKPRSLVDDQILARYAEELITKIRAAGEAPVPTPAWQNRPPRTDIRGDTAHDRRSASRTLIAIGASTGGTEAIPRLLAGLAADGPGVLVVQHINHPFDEAFARRLDALLAQRVRLAEDGATVERGCVYVAPAERHLRVVRRGDTFCCELSQEAPVGHHRPAVDLLFESVARHVGAAACGVLLTGMGRDGASGLAVLHHRGAYTLAQNEASSVVWGMPGAAVELDACDRVADVDEIGALVNAHFATSHAGVRATAR